MARRRPPLALGQWGAQRGRSQPPGLPILLRLTQPPQGTSWRAPHPFGCWRLGGGRPWCLVMPEAAVADAPVVSGTVPAGWQPVLLAPGGHGQPSHVSILVVPPLTALQHRPFQPFAIGAGCCTMLLACLGARRPLCVCVCGVFYYRGEPICGMATSSPMPATARGAARCRLGPAALPRGKNLSSGEYDSGTGSAYIISRD